MTYKYMCPVISYGHSYICYHMCTPCTHLRAPCSGALGLVVVIFQWHLISLSSYL